MGGVGSFRFLDDLAIADCALDVEGTSLDDLFETAALALARVMADPATIEPRLERTITLTSPALDLLLYDWLSELIFLKDRDRTIFPSATVRVHGGGPFDLTARLHGDVIDPETMTLGSDPKAVTFHAFELTEDAKGWRARIVIDL